LIAHVSGIFLLPVFEKSVIFNDFRVIAHSISAQEGGNTVCCNAMARTRTVDDSVTCWFPCKDPMVRRRGLEFGVFQAPIFRSLDVCLAVSDVLRSTPTTPSVKEYRYRLSVNGFVQLQY